MKRIRFYAFIGMLTIAYLIGCIMGFALCASSTKSYAKSVPVIMDVQNTQSNVCNAQTIYVEGQKYVVFTSGSSSMAVIKK